MNARDRYERLIQTIEEKAQNPYLTAQEIAEEVAAQNFMSYRDMSTVMKFLTDDPLLAYINERRMMAAYTYLVTSGQGSISRAAEFSGLGTISSFNRKFKSTFGITPTDAKRDKNMDLLVPPLDWDAISCETEDPLTAEEEVEQMENVNMFGIPKDQYEKLIEATDLAAFYGLEPEKSNLAFELSKKLERPLTDTFRYISELLEFGYGMIDEEVEGCECTNPEAFLDDANDPLLQFLFFECDLHIDLAYEVIDRLGYSAKEIMAKDPRTLHIFAKIPDVRFAFIENAMAYYSYHATDEYDDLNLNSYIDMICLGVPKEVAFERLTPGSSFSLEDYIPGVDDAWEDDPFEDQVLENDRWHGQRIDIEGDPDNTAYDDEAGPY